MGNHHVTKLEGCRFAVELVVAAVVQNGEAAYRTSPLVRRTASLVSEEKSSLGMFVKRKPLRVQPEAFIHLQRRHPLRHVPINEKRQGQEIPHMVFV